MNSSKKKAEAQAVGGKTARACDSCIKKRARWYCAADDAFLCQSCDSSVHSANQLARRHERVLLKTASSLKPTSKVAAEDSVTAPSWHRGFTRKARTPRHGKSTAAATKSQEGVRSRFLQVPEVGADESNSYDDENEEDQRLLYRVPIYDPFISELCTNSSEEAVANYESNSTVSKLSSPLGNYHDGFLLPSAVDLAEFAADVDSLLGRGLDNDECFGMEGLGLMDGKDQKESDCRVKVEEEEERGGDSAGCQFGETTAEMDMMREPFVLNFEDYDDSLASCGEEDDKLRVGIMMKGSSSSANCQHEVEEEEDGNNRGKKRKILLSLNYEAVITAWDSERSPWTTGARPDVECLQDCMGGCGGGLHFPYGDLNGIGVHTAMVDGGREARVSRYREKRRTRLFSKKIRYEVRKLNAEKRPRMKGRFVKRTSFGGSTSSSTFPVLS